MLLLPEEQLPDCSKGDPRRSNAHRSGSRDRRCDRHYLGFTLQRPHRSRDLRHRWHQRRRLHQQRGLTRDFWLGPSGGPAKRQPSRSRCPHPPLARAPLRRPALVPGADSANSIGTPRQTPALASPPPTVHLSADPPPPQDWASPTEEVSRSHRRAPGSSPCCVPSVPAIRPAGPSCFTR